MINQLKSTLAAACKRACKRPMDLAQVSGNFSFPVTNQKLKEYLLACSQAFVHLG